jgi:hypothetical protein
MNIVLQNEVLRTMSEVRQEPSSHTSLCEALKLPPLTHHDPLEVYLLVSLLKHERRQRWVGLIVESRLSAEGEKLGRFGAFGHPEGIDQKGPVPGEDDWSYFFHGRGCCLTHTDGTAIDVDFADDGSTQEIDPYFYLQYLTSAKNLDWCEKKILGQAGLEMRWKVALPVLHKAGLIVQQHRCRLTEEGRSMAEALEPLLDGINDEEGIRTILLARLGDYTHALNSLESEEKPPALLITLAESQQISRIKLLRQALKAAKSPWDAQDILADLFCVAGTDALPELETCLLKKPVDGLNLTALNALRRLDGNGADHLLHQAFWTHSAKPLLDHILRKVFGKPLGREMPWNALMIGIIEEIMWRAPVDGMNAGLQTAFRKLLMEESLGVSDDDAGILLYLLDQKAGLMKLSSAIRSTIPSPRKGSSAILAWIGTAPCVELLMEAANGPTERGGHEAACALSLLDDPCAKEAALQWLRRHDGYDDLGEAHVVTVNGRSFPTWSMKDIARAQVRESIAYEIGAIEKRFGQLLAKWRPVVAS